MRTLGRSIASGIWVTLVALWLSAGVAAANGTAHQPTDFELKAPNEKTVKLSDYRGQWVVVNFWATWCPPCLAEIPDLVKFHKLHAGKAAMVLGVNFEELDLFLLEDFMTDHDMVYPNGQAGGVPLVPFEPLLGLPATFLVDPKGRIVKRHTGPINYEWLEQTLAKARAG